MQMLITTLSSQGRVSEEDMARAGEVLYSLTNKRAQLVRYLDDLFLNIPDSVPFEARTPDMRALAIRRMEEQ